MVKARRVRQGGIDGNGVLAKPNRAAFGVQVGERALVLITSSNCHFCRESLPFYRALVARARTSDVRVVGVTREDPEVNRAYLWANGVLVDAVLSGIDIGVPTERTPTLIVIPRVGLGKGWVGKLSKERQAEVDGYFETVVAGRQE